MKTIYRYEKNNIEYGWESPGPYNASHVIERPKQSEYCNLSYNMNNKHRESVNHPPIYIDMKGFEKGIFCACLSIKELKEWFKGYNAKLKRLGFDIAEYKVKQIYETNSGKQCGFIQKNVISKKIIE